MLLFAFAAMFFIGQQYAYSKAMTYANQQIDEKVNEFKIMKGIQGVNPDFTLGNIEMPSLGGQDEE